jgi:hypothetical protein
MNKTIVYVLGGVVLAGAFGFAYYAISPLFINIKVDEALPGQMIEEGPASMAPPEVPSETAAKETLRASVVDTPAHPASGFVRTVEAEGKTYVRYEDYKTINGPDLYVYLAKDLDAKEFINLGRLKATEGNVNYEIPTNTDVGEYRYALTWCKQFGVLFNSADLSSAR